MIQLERAYARRFLVAAAAAFAVSSSWAQPKIEPGLWEISLGGDLAGMMEKHMGTLQKQLADMPPDMQEQMRAMLAQQMQSMSKPQMHCITPEDVKKGFQSMMNSDAGPGQDECTQAVEWTGNVAAIRLDCADGAHGKGKITVISAKQITTEMQFVDPEDGPINMSWQGRWAKASCAGVK